MCATMEAPGGLVFPRTPRRDPGAVIASRARPCRVVQRRTDPIAGSLDHHASPQMGIRRRWGLPASRDAEESRRTAVDPEAGVVCEAHLRQRARLGHGMCLKQAPGRRTLGVVPIRPASARCHTRGLAATSSLRRLPGGVSTGSTARRCRD